MAAAEAEGGEDRSAASPEDRCVRRCIRVAPMLRDGQVLDCGSERLGPPVPYRSVTAMQTSERGYFLISIPML